MSSATGKIVRGTVGSVVAVTVWLLLARTLFVVRQLSDLRDAGGRIWLGLGLIAVALATLVVVAVLRLGEATRPRTGALSLRLGWPGVVAVTASLLGGAVATTTLADRAAHLAANDAATQVGRYLVESTRSLPLAEATAFLRAHAQLGAWSAVWVAPSGLLLPEDLAAQIAGWPSIELPLAGSLLGGQLRVAWQPHTATHVPVVAIALLVLLLALAHAAAISGRIARDVAAVTRQVSAVAADATPDEKGPSRTTAWSAELRKLTTSTNRLLDRVPRLTMASFVAIERANEAQRFKSQFLANMSHDLRSPLNSILGFSELLLRGLEGDLQPAETEALAAIHARGLSLLRLLGEILDTAKAESGRMELRRHATAPAELVQQALSETRRSRAAPTPGTATGTVMPVSMERLQIELQPGLSPVFVDPLRLQQALTHLFNHLLDEEDERPVDVRISDGLVDEGERRKRYLIVDVALPGRRRCRRHGRHLRWLFAGAPQSPRHRARQDRQSHAGRSQSRSRR